MSIVLIGLGTGIFLMVACDGGLTGGVDVPIGNPNVTIQQGDVIVQQGDVIVDAGQTQGSTQVTEVDQDQETSVGGGGGLGVSRIEICHIPPGDPDNAHTIRVPETALLAHLRHGDSLGACDCEHGDANECDHAPCMDKECTAGECVYTPIECADDDLCTIDSCDPETDACVFDPVVCDDNDACTEDACVTGECVYTSTDCDDVDPCTVDSCDPDTGECVNVDLDCSDGDPCTMDSCDPESGDCAYEPIVCADDDLCTIDECDPETGDCLFVAVECPEAQACLNGECVDNLQEIIISSGGTEGVCGGEDPATLVSSPSNPDPQPAPIAGGNTHAVCDCSSDEWSGDPGLLPVTTTSNSDAWGDFVTHFDLPAGATDPAIQLRIRADDGAEIYLNDMLVDTIDLVPAGNILAVTHTIQIDDSTLFLNGENALRFYVVNTQSGHFGNPVGRGGPGDCMYVQFEARITYLGPPPGLIAWWRMEDRDGDGDGAQIPDASGHGHHLTINGTPTFEGNVVVFNDDGTLETPDSDELDLLGDWTVSYWVREDSNDHSPNSNPTNGWMSKHRSFADAEGGWFLNSSDNNGVFAVIYGSPNCDHRTSPNRLVLGRWYRLTTTFDSAAEMLRIYFDDTLEYEAEPACSHSMGNNDFPVLLGGNIESNMSRRPFCKGAMADVRIYDRTLSADEVVELYGNGF